MLGFAAENITAARSHAAMVRKGPLRFELVEMDGKGADIAFVVREAFGKGCFLRD